MDRYDRIELEMRIGAIEKRVSDLERTLCGVVAALKDGCADCIYAKPRHAEQCQGCTVWEALVAAGIEPQENDDAH